MTDEDVFTSTVRLIRARGFEVRRAHDLGLSGAKDPVVLRKAQELKAVLVTNDRGFGDVRAYPPTSHAGIIVLKMTPNPNRVEEVHRVLEQLLQREQRFEQTLFVADSNKYRKRIKP